mmetsp:Transcript_8656/g.18940  ORF Transcript_8656/g.18940 Transcript_8656/m.18940 type:complete len:207 (-) Transcript_8656:50-670(-)
MLLAAGWMVRRHVYNTPVLPEEVARHPVNVHDLGSGTILREDVESPFDRWPSALRRHGELHGDAILGVVLYSEEPGRLEIWLLLLLRFGFLLVALALALAFPLALALAGCSKLRVPFTQVCSRNTDLVTTSRAPQHTSHVLRLVHRALRPRSGLLAAPLASQAPAPARSTWRRGAAAALRTAARLLLSRGFSSLPVARGWGRGRGG